MRNDTRMAKKPIRYHRNIPNTILEARTLLKEFKTGEIVHFTYGQRQEAGETGGWKNDPRPRLLVYYDDGNKYIEGVNTNYLPTAYLVRLMKLLVSFPGIGGRELYSIVKRTAPEAHKKGYRKYFRTSMRNPVVSKPLDKSEKKPKATKKLTSKKPKIPLKTQKLVPSKKGTNR